MSCDVVVGTAVLVFCVCATVVVGGTLDDWGCLTVDISQGLVDDVICGIVVVGREVDVLGSASVILPVVAGEFVDSEVCGTAVVGTAVLGTEEVVVMPVGTVVVAGDPVGNSAILQNKN